MKTNKEGVVDGGTAFFRFNSSLNLLENDRIISVPSYNKVMAEYDRDLSLSHFKKWALSLNEWYSTH